MRNPTEEQASELIDLRITLSGWHVQTYKDLNLGTHGPAEYLLYVDGNPNWPGKMKIGR